MEITIQDIIAKAKQNDPKIDSAQLQRAYDIAQTAYAGKTVAGGRAMLDHAMNVADALAGYNLDINTISAGLLHNALPFIETPKDKLRAELGSDLFNMIELLASLNSLKFAFDENEQSGEMRRMFIAMAKDVRIIMIKLSNRLDIMRNIDDMEEAHRLVYARETLEIFSPLAHRLGVSQLKSEIEDLAFKWLHPKEFDDLRQLSESTREHREKALALVIGELKEFFKSVNFNVHITGRTKHIYSMYKKMMRQGIQFNELFDLTAIRIIVDKVAECYQVLSMLHTNWTPVPDTFDDYIQEPKQNGYQSLHTVVVGPLEQPVELQIRTWEMHMTAEYGVAAHWRYKEEASSRPSDDADGWIRRIIDRRPDMQDPANFLRDVTLDPFDNKVFVLTPLGKVLTLPSGSTPIDAAYLIHTDVGHRCMGARINSKIAPLDSTLRNGDVVEIMTAKTGRPSRDWLKIVRSGGARQKIRAWFKKQNRDENIHHGRSMLERELDHAGLKRKDIIAQIGYGAIIKSANLKTEEDLYAAIGCGDVSVETAVHRIRKDYRDILQKEEGAAPPSKAVSRPSRKKKKDISVEGISDILVTFAKCCFPLPGDEIVGFVSQGRGISIHRDVCPNIKDFVARKERIVPVSWEMTEDHSYAGDIEIHSLNRSGLLNDILGAVSENKTQISGMKSKTLKDTTLLTNIRLEVRDAKHAANIVNRIRRIEDVLSADRTI